MNSGQIQPLTIEIIVIYYIFFLASITKHSNWKPRSALPFYLYGFSHFIGILGPENWTEIKACKTIKNVLNRMAPLLITIHTASSSERN